MQRKVMVNVFPRARYASLTTGRTHFPREPKRLREMFGQAARVYFHGRVYAFEEGPIERMQSSLLRFQQAARDAVVADEFDRWATLTTPTMEVNDPDVATYTLADGATATRLLFHSANAGGLMVQWTDQILGADNVCPPQ